MTAGEVTRPTGAGPAAAPPTPGAKRAARRNDPVRQTKRNGLPVSPNRSEPLPKRILQKKLFWLSVALVAVYVVLMVMLYQQTVPDQQGPNGRIPGIGVEAFPLAAKYAAITAIPLSIVFMITDRFRPWRLWIWLMALGWGACVATFVSAQVNTWAAGHLSIIGDGDPASGARAAIFVAPWVEEASKATVLFGIAILLRYRWVSRVSGVVLAGLSGTGFAFTENILYYGRAYHYASQVVGVTPEDIMHELFVLRGVKTFFGHPLFTSMTGIGLAIALRSKSKVVRIVAPLAGYCLAAFLHMSFNTSATLAQGVMLVILYVAVALPLVAAMVVFTIRQLFRENRLIRERLTDYVRVGWLPEQDIQPLARIRTRIRAVWQSLWLGPRVMLDTVMMHRAMIELAYLRDSIARGLVDEAGLQREKELLARIRELRPTAIIRPAPRANYPKRRAARSEVAGYAPASYPGPAGLGGNYPAQPGTAPIGPGAVQYSEVNPDWKPPGS